MNNHISDALFSFQNMYNYLFTEFLHFISKKQFFVQKLKILRLLEDNFFINKTRIMSNLTRNTFSYE